ncbi:type VI secretion system contractile sheath large subunit [Falsiroseomonas selenitidurans]|uniref:Type VI secretion system contractile sheath large subunit n=1 Tax=Falsiroseomonas selenitidurans TaxID=2716335 RepID=A0ABX1EF04_9PROT|nr:type VI secretion system contractile sheath large subunit [Falsiroseomonas selenitidurans]NKC34102.1 type VI secretion system contractile sheath large subunit [Falsiroseomonas selenitidurans]
MDPATPLRDAVLAGRFLGRDAAAAPLAALVAEAAPARLLLGWFGEARLAGFARDPDPVEALRGALDRDVAALDAMLSAQLDAVLAAPRLSRLEGSWRGLAWLVDRLPPTGGRVRVKLLSARWAELCRDLERAVEFDQSQVFRKIYEEEFGTAGGEPFGMIAADYEVRHMPAPGHPTDDVGALTALAGVAAAAFAPLVLAASPALVGLDAFADAAPAFDLASALSGPEHARWRNAAAQEDMRFLCVALPRVLGRAPWPDDGSRVDRFRYRSHAPGVAQRVWTTPVYGLAAAAIRAFDRYAWPGEVRGAEPQEEAVGGVLDHLPFERFAADPPGPPPRAPLDLALTDEQERQISDARLVPLSALEGLAEASFGALPALHRPPRMNSAVAEANQRLSTQINTLLCVSRFAHCIKLMGRDMVGSAREAPEVEYELQRWLDRFVSGLGSGGAEVTAKFPLMDAKVEVRERRGKPGVYGCTVHLKPHHQLDEVGAAFRLVTEFAPRRGAAA